MEHTVDQVITATGYRVDVNRLEFLDSALLEKLKTVENAPALSGKFESSVPGLYFVGLQLRAGDAIRIRREVYGYPHYTAVNESFSATAGSRAKRSDLELGAA